MGVSQRFQKTLNALRERLTFSAMRCLLRDVTQRGGDLEGAVAWYRRDVIPNFPVYTEPCKGYADLVVPFLDENPVALQPLVARLRDRIVNQCSSVQLGM